MTRHRLLLPLLALAVMLGACRQDAGQPETPATPEAAPHEPAGPAPAPGSADPPAPAQEGPFTPAHALPAERSLEVTVEGQTEQRSARLFESPQRYAIYVLPQLQMTPEEPCCDLAYARADADFSMRIERLDPRQDVAGLRADMVLALSSVGEAEAVPAREAGATGFGDAELFMRARGDGVTSTMLVARIDGGRYRVTLHLPHREAYEGIAPSLWAMLGSLRTTGPRPEA